MSLESNRKTTNRDSVPGVTITVDSGNITVEGPKSKLVQFITPAVDVNINDGVLTVNPKDESKQARIQHGLMRALINNMVIGVTKGYEKRLRGQRCWLPCCIKQ